MDLETKKEKYYNIITNYFNQYNTEMILNNYLNNEQDLLKNTKIYIDDTAFKMELDNFLKEMIKDVLQYYQILSDDNIIKVINSILSKMVKDEQNGEWSYLFKKDVLYDYQYNYVDLMEYFDSKSIESLADYSSNAWNNVICLRALIKWLENASFESTEKETVLKTIFRAYEKIRAYIFPYGVSKYPLGIADNIISVYDTSFVLKMINLINKTITKYKEDVMLIQMATQLKVLFSKQNADGGWSKFLIKENGNITKFKNSDVCATSYTLLFLLDLANSPFDNEEIQRAINNGILFLLNHFNEDKKCWCDNNGEVNIENTCIAYQVLLRQGIPQKPVEILSFLKTHTNKNLKYFINNDIDTLNANYSKNPIRNISLVLVSFLKSGLSLKTSLISIPFSWLLHKATSEDKTNLIYIICSISDYFSAEKISFLGEDLNKLQDSSDFVL